MQHVPCSFKADTLTWLLSCHCTMSHLIINLSEPESSTTRSRVRLTKEGSAFLSSTCPFPLLATLLTQRSSDYARTANPYPHKTEKQAILASLRTIPGNEAFTLDKLNNWLTRHRKPSRACPAPAPLPQLTLPHSQATYIPSYSTMRLFVGLSTRIHPHHSL